jgi:hypothetical protein
MNSGPTIGPAIAARRVIMRAYCLILLCSCSAEVASQEEPPGSVRERLERDDTALAIRSPDSAGTLTAQRRTGDEWVAGLVDLAIVDGEIVTSAASDGAITVERFAVSLGPIDVPASVLGYDVQLTDIHLETASPVRVDTTWRGDDDARGTLALDLVLAWSLTNHGETSPLGAPDLPPIPVELLLTGDAGAVDAELRLRAPGELWSWADLIRLEDLTLILAASTR